MIVIVCARLWKPNLTVCGTLHSIWSAPSRLTCQLTNKGKLYCNSDRRDTRRFNAWCIAFWGQSKVSNRDMATWSTFITIYLNIPALVPRCPLGRIPLEVMSESTHLQFPWARVSSKDLALISFTLVAYDHAITFAEEVNIIVILSSS